MTMVQLLEKHKELSREVERLSKLKSLTAAEQQNLVTLKKLKLSYKDAISQAMRVKPLT